ncbi:CD4-1 molecule [Hypomesus transpacificus]|uniref:CD4-1 molecule n=1 Tax=Hypomesus transpacificus TaxID=137520 RepID=UPI001F0801EC|nr:CD4-1 molecule [Hypomesus transpacificus]
MKDFSGRLPMLIVLFISTTGAVDAVNVVAYGEVGGQITLNGINPKTNLYVYWSSDGQDLISKNTHGVEKKDDKWKDRVSLDRYSLSISQLRKEDFTKSFTCELKMGNILISTTTYSLRTMSVRPPASSLLAGETLSLRCDLQGSNKLPVRWSGPQTRDLSMDNRVQGANGISLTVKNVSGKDHGQWLCVVTSGSQEYSASAPVVVVDLSLAPKQPIYSSTSSLSPLIPCSIPSYVTLEELKAKDTKGAYWSFTPDRASGLPSREPKKLLALGPPPAWESLLKSDKKLPALQKNNHNFSLQWSGVTEGDRGEYTCALEFKGDKTLKRVIHLEVLQVISSRGPQLLIGQDVNLTCSLGRPMSADLSVKWIRPTQRGSPTSSHSQRPALNTTHLAIQEVGSGDCGRWKCELWRKEEKLTTAEIMLKIERAPMDVWLLVTICAATVIFILLLILTVILFRRRQQRGTMPRRRKHKFCRCKEPKPKGFYRT